MFLFTVHDLDPSSPNFDGRVSVTGTFGWPAVPTEIVEATRMLAIRYLRRMREATFGVIQAGLDGTAIRIANVDPDVESLIAPYRRTFIGY